MIMDSIKKGNMEIFKDYLLLSLNPKIYPIDVIYSASYVMISKAYIILDGEPESEIIVEIRPKVNYQDTLEDLGNEFNEELINYGVYKFQSEKNKTIRETLIQRALITNSLASDAINPTFDDPEGIAIPWEEKYGKDKNPE
jgi:His-Xaa-Ser system protein HxsD